MEEIFIENNWHFVKIKETGPKLLATELSKGGRNHLQPTEEGLRVTQHNNFNLHTDMLTMF